MTDPEFDFVRRLLQERSAISLDSGKQYLVEARLAPIVRQLKLNSMGDLIAQLRSRPGDDNLFRQIVEAMVTGESSFFRDHHPFEALRKTVIPDLINRRRDERRLNIWCAACSTGQEPYSVALLLREHFPVLAAWKISLLATDLSRPVLDRARKGCYNQIEANRGLPAALLIKYFEQHGTDWQLSPAVRSQVEFRELNLAHAWPPLPPMDLVLIRNVMIYFDVDTKKNILAKLARLLKTDGYLLMGGAETTFGLSDSFQRVEPVKAGFYQLAPSSVR
jgi:chemotaxis protein methyltransferase CheR